MESAGIYARRRAGAAGLLFTFVGAVVGGILWGLDSWADHRLEVAQDGYTNASATYARLGTRLHTLTDEASAILAEHEGAALTEPSLAYLVVCIGRAQVVMASPVDRAQPDTLDEVMEAQAELDAVTGERQAAADDLDAAIDVALHELGGS